MRQITLRRLAMEHFKSFDQPVEIDLPTAPGMVMVAGDNRVEPRMGANGCLSGNTLIDCPRDLKLYPRGIPLRRLLGKQFYTYSWDEERQTLVLSWASKVWKTGYREVYRVPLSPYPQYQKNLGNRKGGTTHNSYLPPCELVGTYDHPVMLCDGTWKKLGELTPGDSLKSLYRSSGDGRCQLRWSGQLPSSITNVGWQKNTKPFSYYRLEHGVSEQQFVCEAVNGARPEGVHAHHIDENPLNHSPSNLEWKDAFRHLSEHTSKRNSEGLSGWQVTGVHPRGMKGKYHSDEAKERISRTGKGRVKSEEERRKLSEALTGRKFPVESRRRMSESAKRNLGTCPYCGMTTNTGNIARWHGDRCVSNPHVNHRVTELSQKIGYEWVYDIQVEDTHNFVANGVFVHNSGKSTLFDALVFCLTGSSVRGARGSDLITYGEKRCSVSAEFDIDGEAVTLSRDGPPFHPFIGGRQVEQADVDRTFGLSRLRLLNSVVFGQAVPLFIDLPVPQRGELLDEVLDLQLWMRASRKAGDRWGIVEKELDRLRVEIGRTEGALDALEDAAELRVLVEQWDASHEERKRSLLESVRTAISDLRTMRDQLASFEAKAPADATILFKAFQDRQKRESGIKSELAVVDHAIAQLAEDLNFFVGNSVCPSCGQEIDEDLVERHRIGHQTELDKLQGSAETLGKRYEVAQKATKAAQASWQQANADGRTYAGDLARLRAGVTAKATELENLQRQSDRLAEEENPHAERLVKLRETRRVLREKLREQKRSERGVNSKLAQLDFWRQAFRRVRLYCMDRALKELDVEAMNAARSLGLVGWKITHTTETETRSGTAKMGVQVEVTSPIMKGPFVAWSGGEGQRVRLSSALGLAGMIQRWAGVRWNLEVFDEPTAWLSETGIEDLLDLLKNRADLLGKTVFVCDHRGLQHAGFDSIITVVKGSQGSYIDG